MTPLKVLKEYLKDIKSQEWVALNVIGNEKEVSKIKDVRKEFEAAIGLINFYTKEGYAIKITPKKTKQ